jgi:micrococcal nuclease
MRKVLVFFCLLFIGFSSVFAANSKFKVKLDKCVDGDTAKFVINDEVKTVRFLSINTPEIKHGSSEAEAFGDEAKDFTCSALKDARSIKLQYDPKSDQTDKYGRVLAWVFVDDDLLQEKLVTEGLAEIKYVYADYLYTDSLKALEEVAKNAHRGIWSVVDEASDSINDSVMSRKEVIIAIVSIVAIVIVCIFGKSASGKKKAIKEIRKISGI